MELSCSTLDYLPTIREAVGCSMPGKPRPIDGISLMPLIAGRMTSRPGPICFRYIEPKTPMHGSPTLAMLKGRYKLLTNLSADGKEDMLYDVISDRAETTNVMAQYPDMARSMKARLRAWLESCKASHAGVDYDGPFQPKEPFPLVTGTWPEERRVPTEQ